ncbi:unnamed protein product [Scytosiphon promiscuus]
MMRRRRRLREPEETLGARKRTAPSSFLRLVVVSTLVFGVGPFCLYVVVSFRRKRQQDRDVDDFLENVWSMYLQGQPSMLADGGAGGPGGGGSGGGDGIDANGTPSARRYDPKARVFVDANMQQRYGQEAEKGRHKRRLFMEVHDMAKAKGRPLLTLPQLLSMPSSFDPSATGMFSDTTIILNHWTRTTLEEQLDAILRQTVRPAGGVWVCAFNSPREAEYRRVVERYRSKFSGKRGSGGLFFVASSFNFKYYGRFQLALQARTKYVWIVDDDVMPGSRFLEQLSHIAGIPEAEGADGSLAPMALGSVGWIMPGVKATEHFYSYRYHTDKGGLYLPDKRYGIPVPHLQEVDLLCSHWFVETDWVRLLFREKWETPQTGEDYMLAYSLRKHAGVRSYVLPMDLSDSETWGNVDRSLHPSHPSAPFSCAQGGTATTLRSTVPMRDRIWHRLFKRGGEYFMSLRYASRPRPLLLVIDSLFDAQALRSLFVELQASYPPTNGGTATASAKEHESTSSSRTSSGKGAPQQRPPRVVLTGRGGSSVTCPVAAKELGNTQDARGRGATLCDPDTFASAWNLAAGRHFPRQGTSRAGGSGGRDHVLMGDLAAGLAGAVQTLKPLAIVSALAVVAGQAEVPVIRLPRKADASAAALWLARLTPKAFRAWHKPRVDLVVLEALLESLSNAHYLGDSVDLTVAVGSGPVPEIVSDEFFSWPRGRKVSFVVVLQADRVVSPLFYSWLKAAVLETNYGPAAPKSSGPGARSARTGSRSGVCVPSSVLGQRGGRGGGTGRCVRGPGLLGASRGSALPGAEKALRSFGGENGCERVTGRRRG